MNAPESGAARQSGAGGTQHPLERFAYGDHTVRTVMLDGEPWFVTIDVCGVLDIRNASDAMSTLDDDEKGVVTTDTPGGAQQVRVLSEAGLYSLILRSRKPDAKPFKRWVTHEVLPQIRQTGAYSPTVVPPRELSRLELIDMAREAEVGRLAAIERAELAEHRNEELEPLAEAYSQFLEDDGTVKWANAAESLGVGPNLLGDWLRDIKVLRTDTYLNRDRETRQGERHNRPYAEYEHWFAFPAYTKPERAAHVPAHRQFDRRVTKTGMDGIFRLLVKHIRGCGTCPMCAQYAKRRPEMFQRLRANAPAPRGHLPHGSAA